MKEKKFLPRKKIHAPHDDLSICLQDFELSGEWYLSDTEHQHLMAELERKLKIAKDAFEVADRAFCDGDVSMERYTYIEKTLAALGGESKEWNGGV